MKSSRLVGFAGPRRSFASDRRSNGLQTRAAVTSPDQLRRSRAPRGLRKPVSARPPRLGVLGRLVTTRGELDLDDSGDWAISVSVLMPCFFLDVWMAAKRSSVDIGFRGASSRVIDVLLLLSGDFSDPELERLVEDSAVGEPSLRRSRKLYGGSIVAGMGMPTWLMPW